MNRHLRYAQAIAGISKGRGIGIIVTLHLAEIPLAIEALKSSQAMTPEMLSGLKAWFAAYADWMTTHTQGIEEMNKRNNHSGAYFVQLAAFARLTDDAAKLETARHRFKNVPLPDQMDLKGSFPAELSRCIRCRETLRFCALHWAYCHPSAVYLLGLAFFSAVFIVLCSKRPS